MKKISKLHISQFRGLNNVGLDDMRKFNLLVGENNSGKTSILEALATYCRPLDLREWLNAARRRELMLPNVAFIDSLRWFFPQNTLSKEGFYRGETCCT